MNELELVFLQGRRAAVFLSKQQSPFAEALSQLCVGWTERWNKSSLPDFCVEGKSRTSQPEVMTQPYRPGNKPSQLKTYKTGLLTGLRATFLLEVFFGGELKRSEINFVCM